MKAQLSSDILDTTKRCTNGHCLLRKYNEIVATEEVLEYLHTLQLGHFIRNASERVAPNYAPGAMVERWKCSDRAKDNKCPCAIHNILDGYQNTGVCKHVLHGSVCFAGVDIPDELKDQIRSNAKRGAKSKRTKALENQTGKQPSPCKPPKKNKNVASTSEKVSEVESEVEDDETL